MTIFERIAEVIFNSAVHRERQRSAQYGRLALATWCRHADGRPAESPEIMREAAQCVVGWYGAESQHAQQAIRVLREIGT